MIDDFELGIALDAFERPLTPDVAGDQEREGGSRDARERNQEGPPKHPEQQAASEGEGGSGNKQHGSQNVSEEVDERSPKTESPHPLHEFRDPFGNREEAREKKDGKDED